MRKFLIALSGAQPEILDKCRTTERLKFETLGTVILITSGMAMVSMWFALTNAMGVYPVVALPAAVLWGLIIMGIDRWLVISMSGGAGERRWTIAIPRILLAILLGSLISTPFVLRIFQSEINEQITVIKAQRASNFLAEQQNNNVGRQVTYWRAEVARWQKIIDTGGDEPINPSTDPRIQSLTAQRIAEQKVQQQYYTAWQCQLYGGPDCTQKGNGPLAQASKRSYDQATAQIGTLADQIQQRENQLSATDASSKAMRLQQATAARPGAQQQLAAAEARQNVLQQNFDARNEDTNGLLIRLQALSDLSGKGFTLNAARGLLFLLFLVIECLPVTVKLMQRRGNYDKLLRLAAESELREAKKAYRRPAAGPTATQAAGLREIWERPDAMPSRVRPDDGMVSSSPDRPEESDEHTLLDNEALRGMEDVRTRTDSGHDGSGVLHYGDDDL